MAAARVEDEVVIAHLVFGLEVFDAVVFLVVSDSRVQCWIGSWLGVWNGYIHS